VAHPPTTNDRRDPRLRQQAQLLKASPFFDAHSDAHPLQEKQAIFLALAGMKPVAEASSGHWVATSHGRRSMFDDPKAVSAFLSSLGLAYRLRHDEFATDALVSLQPELLTAYEHAAADGDQANIGELFGYPLTAARAFADGPSHLLPRAELERLERRTGLSIIFALSRAHWQDELAVTQKWAETLRTYEMLKP
jgi:hypothetical protein